MTILVDDLVPDELWAMVEPLPLAPPRPPYGSRRRTIPDRSCFAAIVFMARPTFLGVGFPCVGSRCPGGLGVALMALLQLVARGGEQR